MEERLNVDIRPVRSSDNDDMYELTILAFSPIFTSFKKILGSDIYEAIWPDWKASKKKRIRKLCHDDNQDHTFVAELNGTVVGFITVELDSETKYGTIQLIAVHPDYQCRGIGTQLNTFALTRMKENGMDMAVAETGGDQSHLPARKSYEKSGCVGLPLVRYFKKLN